MADTKKKDETTDAEATAAAEASAAASTASAVTEATEATEAEAGEEGEDEEATKAWDDFEEADKKVADDATPPGEPGEATPAGAEVEPSRPAAATVEGEPAAPATPAGGETQDDIWDGASDAQKAAFKAAQGRAAAAETQDRRSRGSVSGLQRQVSDLTAKVATIDAMPGGAADSRVNAEADEEWDTFAKEYPEVAGPVEKRLTSKDVRIDTLERTLAAVSDTHRDTLYERNEQSLVGKHPDWEVVLGVEGSQENPTDVTAAANLFAGWLGQQPAYLQQAAMRNSDSIVDPEEAGHVIEVYKQSTGVGQRAAAPNTGGKPKTTPLSAKQTRQLVSGAAPRTAGSGPVTSGVPEEGDPAALWEGLEKAGL